MKHHLFTKYVLGILLSISYLSSHGQTIIQGTVIEENGKPLPFVHVILLDHNDSSLVSGAFTDQEGEYLFHADAGNYILKIRSINHETAYQYFSTRDSKELKLAPSILKENSVMLEDIEVSTQRNLIEMDNEKMTVNIKESPTSKGKSVIQLLTQSPGISASVQGGFMLYGQKGVLILINGKSTNLSDDALMQLLTGMNGSKIEKLEIYRIPPAKFDAAGSAGVINIILSENMELGTHGNYGLSIGRNKDYTIGGNFSIDHRTKASNFYFDYSFLEDKNEVPWTDKLTVFGNEFDQTYQSIQERNAVTTSHNIRAGAGFQLSKKTSLQINTTGYFRNWDLVGNTQSDFRLSPEVSLETQTDFIEINEWKSFTGEFSLKHQINKNRSVSISVNHLRYSNQNPSQYLNKESNKLEQEELIQVTKHTPINFTVAQLDYSHKPMEQFEFEFGLKSTLANFDNQVLVYSTIDNDKSLIPEFSNESELNESILAAYASLTWKLNDKSTLVSGLRYEFTDSQLQNPDGTALVDRKFGNLFPTISINHQLNEKDRLGISIARRITRPTFNEIAPFVYFIGPNSFSSGNPALKPALSDQIQLSFSHQGISTTLKYNYVHDYIGIFEPRFVGEENKMTYSSQNLESFQDLSLHSTVIFTPLKWWEIQGGGHLSFQKIASSYETGRFSDQLLYFSFDINSSIKWGKGWRFDVLQKYQSTSFMGIWRMKPMAQMNIGLSKEFGNNSGVITISYSDVFHNWIEYDYLTLPDQSAQVEWFYDWNNRSLNLTFSKSFGNQKLSSKRKKSNTQEERKRVN